ncbi:hypothetical protein AK830_g10887 [Neonectria ditissima]|uniref:Ubiquitin-like domain-containing protein n=1 Tax=Neonectria ditissima TaxID=78410 RepID=A0A0P7ANX2_9HYPO|nr:hypothetical protein AK830_g10887 [Neonectria ditissima]
MFAMSTELSMVRTILVRLERPLNDEYFILEDFTGRSFPIYLKSIMSWDVFEYILYDRFKGKKGGRRIQQKLYTLQDQVSRQNADRLSNWESAVVPQRTITISLVCEDTRGELSERPASFCPVCQTVSGTGTIEDFQCENCGMLYTRFIEMNDNGNTSPEIPAPPQQLEETDNCTSPHGSKDSREEPTGESDTEDLRGLKRVTVVLKKRRVTKGPQDLALPESTVPGYHYNFGSRIPGSWHADAREAGIPLL